MFKNTKVLVLRLLPREEKNIFSRSFAKSSADQTYWDAKNDQLNLTIITEN